MRLKVTRKIREVAVAVAMAIAVAVAVAVGLRESTGRVGFRSRVVA